MASEAGFRTNRVALVCRSKSTKWPIEAPWQAIASPWLSHLVTGDCGHPERSPSKPALVPAGCGGGDRLDKG
jgi:hypothetical protein